MACSSAARNRESRAALLAALEGYPGIFLHARRLAFTHPSSGERLEFTSGPPPVWDEVRSLCEPQAPEA